MIFALTVPGPIEDVEDVRVLEWHVEVERAVALGALIVELETHKAIVEVRANQSGFMRQILCPAGDWRAIGQPLALLSERRDEPLPGAIEGLGPMAVAFEIT